MLFRFSGHFSFIATTRGDPCTISYARLERSHRTSPSPPIAITTPATAADISKLLILALYCRRRLLDSHLHTPWTPAKPVSPLILHPTHPAHRRPGAYTYTRHQCYSTPIPITSTNVNTTAGHLCTPLEPVLSDPSAIALSRTTLYIVALRLLNCRSYLTAVDSIIRLPFTFAILYCPPRGSPLPLCVRSLRVAVCRHRGSECISCGLARF